MQKAKMKLTAFKLSEAVIENVEKPKAVLVESASKSPRYAEDGTPILDSCSKITMQVVDLSVARAIEKLGADSSALKTLTLEFQGSEQNLKEISIEEILGTELNVADADVKLAWQQGRNGSRGGWQGLKLVLDIDEEDEKAENKK
ncbi:hypothetical protein TolaII67_07310 [Lactococcus lactis subsp. lactis]|uniref:hypothetical protein n=1 Tax=Lactococcus lactis TaxID=1358 RepID=UPI00223B39B7|nr:hypothetical protein [Lactococcus lactis]MCT0066765.1 hypothetical protein [Lactococcus lactis subsp. lactis]